MQASDDILNDQTATGLLLAPVKGLRRDFLQQARLLPMAIDGDVARVAAVDPVDFGAVDALRQFFGHDFQLQRADADWLRAAIDRIYSGTHDADAAGTLGDEADGTPEDDLDALKALAEDAPVVRLVQNTLVRAINARASDVHFEVTPAAFKIRFRIDGVHRTFISR